MAAALTGTAKHIRGLNDSAGSPGTTIATTAVEVFGDQSVRFTDAAGVKHTIRDKAAMALLREVLNLDTTTTVTPS